MVYQESSIAGFYNTNTLHKTLIWYDVSKHWNNDAL